MAYHSATPPAKIEKVDGCSLLHQRHFSCGSATCHFRPRTALARSHAHWHRSRQDGLAPLPWLLNANGPRWRPCVVLRTVGNLCTPQRPRDELTALCVEAACQWSWRRDRIWGQRCPPPFWLSTFRWFILCNLLQIWRRRAMENWHARRRIPRVRGRKPACGRLGLSVLSRSKPLAREKVKPDTSRSFSDRNTPLRQQCSGNVCRRLQFESKKVSQFFRFFDSNE